MTRRPNVRACRPPVPACTVAAIISMLGSMPPKGTVITLPRSALSQYSTVEQTAAKLCARRYGIKWKIEDDK